MTDEEIIKKSFEITEDKRLIVKAPFVRVKIPQDFFNHKISELIADEVHTIGVFYIEVYGLDDKEFDIDNLKNPYKILFKMPMQMILCPSNIIEERDSDKNLNTILEFQQRDTFIKSILFIKTFKTVSKIIDLLLKGFLPKEIGYNELLDFIENACLENGADLAVNNTILEVLISELCRDPNDLTKPFRMALKKNPNLKMTDKVFIKIDSLARMYNSFAAISSADPKQGITASINRTRYNEPQKPSVIEEALSDV